MLEKAIKLLLPALEINESNPATTIILAKLLMEKSSLVEVLGVVEKALTRIPEDPDQLAGLFGGRLDRDRALFISEHRTEAGILLKYGHVDKVILALEAILPHYPETPRVLKKVRETCARLGPKDPTARKCLALVQTLEQGRDVVLPEKPAPVAPPKGAGAPTPLKAPSDGLVDGTFTGGFPELIQDDFMFDFEEDSLPATDRASQPTPGMAAEGQATAAEPAERTEGPDGQAPLGLDEPLEGADFAIVPAGVPIPKAPPPSVEDMPVPTAREEIRAVPEPADQPTPPSTDHVAAASHPEQTGGEEQEDQRQNGHFSLGLAYLEMGIIDEAISEFQEACKEGSRLPKCFSLLGQCYRRQGRSRLAVKMYKYGLELADVELDDTLDLLFQLGEAYEESGQWERALESYSDVYGLDAEFKDVSGKIRNMETRLKSGS